MMRLLLDSYSQALQDAVCADTSQKWASTRAQLDDLMKRVHDAHLRSSSPTPFRVLMRQETQKFQTSSANKVVFLMDLLDSQTFALLFRWGIWHWRPCAEFPPVENEPSEGE